MEEATSEGRENGKAAGLKFGKGGIEGTGGEVPPLNPGVRGGVLLNPGNPKG